MVFYLRVFASQCVSLQLFVSYAAPGKVLAFQAFVGSRTRSPGLSFLEHMASDFRLWAVSVGQMMLGFVLSKDGLTDVPMALRRAGYVRRGGA